MRKPHRLPRLFGVATLLLVLAVPAFADAYRYDPAGRLQQIVGPDDTTTVYRYDALGNLLQVHQTLELRPPVVTGVDPTAVRAAATHTVQVTGEHLAEALIQPPTPAFTVSNLVQSDAQLLFDLEISTDALPGTHAFLVTNVDGSDSFALQVLPPLPTLSAYPLPLALPDDGSVVPIGVRLSHADALDHQITVAVTDPDVVELLNDTLSIAAGETAGQVSARGLTAGLTGITLSSPVLASVSYSLYVVGEAIGNVHTAYMEAVGIRVGEGLPAGPDPFDLTGRALPIALVTGAAITGLSPRALDPQVTAATLTLDGYGLDRVTGVRFEPAAGLTPDTIETAPDGHAVTLSLAVAADVPQGQYRVLLEGADAPYQAVPPGTDTFLVVSAPRLDSLSPIVVLTDSVETLTIRGAYLADLLSLRIEPPTGILWSTPRVDSSGTEVTVDLAVAADAPLGPRVLIAQTSSGETPTESGPQNTFEVVADTLFELPGLTSPLVGVTPAGGSDPQPPWAVTDYAPAIGLLRGPGAETLAPRAVTVGTEATLVVTGHALEAIDTVSFRSAGGIGVVDILVAPDGGQADIALAIAPDAAEVQRRLLLHDAAGGSIPFADPSEALFLVTAPAPRIHAVDPNTLAVGTGSQAVSLYGRDFDRAEAVLVSPSDGLDIGAPAVAEDGNRLTFSLGAAADAGGGARLVQVVTPGGISSDTPSPQNTLILHTPDQVVIAPAPQIAALVGVRVQAPLLVPMVEDLAAPLVGVAVAAVPGEPDPIPVTPLLTSQAGIGVGPLITAVEAPPLDLGGTYTLRVLGRELDALDGAGLFPGLDLSLSLPVVSGDGTEATMILTIPPSAAIENRELRLLAGAERLPFSQPALAIIRVGQGLPLIDHHIDPIVGRPGDAFTLTIQGGHLGDARRVFAEPAGGLEFGPRATVSADGTLLTVPAHVAADASPGSYVVRVETVVGTSTAAASAYNSFTLY